MHAKVKIISICPADFLAEYFMEALKFLQFSAAFISFYLARSVNLSEGLYIFYFTSVVGLLN